MKDEVRCKMDDVRCMMDDVRCKTSESFAVFLIFHIFAKSNIKTINYEKTSFNHFSDDEITFK